MRDRDDSSQEHGSPRVPRRRDHAVAAAPDHPLHGLQEQVGNRALRGLLDDAGRPLSGEERHPMEASLGRDLGGVRVHQGASVDQAAGELDAAAFTAGSDVYLTSEVPAADTAAGRYVLGEELAHVAQGVGRSGADRVLPADDGTETQAHAAAAAAVRGDRAHVTAQPAASTAVGRLDMEKYQELIRETSGGVAAELEHREQADAALRAEQERAQFLADNPVLSPGEYARLVAIIPNFESAATVARTKPTDAQAFWDTHVASSAGLVDAMRGPDSPMGVRFVSLSTGSAYMAAMRIAAPANLHRNALKILAQHVDQPIHAAVEAAADPEVGAADTPVPPKTVLTASEGRQLDAGARQPIHNALGLIDAGDYEGARTLLAGVTGVLSTFTDPPEVAKALGKAGRNLQFVLNMLDALTASEDEAWEQVAGHLENAARIIPTLDPAEVVLPGDPPPE